MGEAKVKSYKRRTKSGKTIQVRAYSRSCKGGCSTAKGAGSELSAIKDKALREKIASYVAAVTDGEYSSADKYTWKDVLAAARHPSEQSLRSGLKKKFGLDVKGVKSKPYNYYNEGAKKPKKPYRVGDKQFEQTNYSISWPLLD